MDKVWRKGKRESKVRVRVKIRVGGKIRMRVR